MRSKRNAQVALVSMPFGPVETPALGLSYFKASLAKVGIASDILYLNHKFAELISPSLYTSISGGWPTIVALLGEWVFSSPSRDDRDYIDVILKPAIAEADSAEPAADLRAVLDARRNVGAFLDSCVTSLPWEDYALVGFTSSFQQHVASRTLANRLKARFPSLFVVFGGANCESVMGRATLRVSPYIDAVCTGEGDDDFPALVRDVLVGRPIRPLLNVQFQSCAARAPSAHVVDAFSPRKHSLVDLATLPLPDYDDYFLSLAQYNVIVPHAPKLLIETSRGCWWGQRSHCTFCGLNGSTIAFRRKSAERALAEIRALFQKYGHLTRRLDAVDNILPFEYFSTLLPLLRDGGPDVDLFYEVKANLRQDKVELLAAAGITAIQPGIESFSDNVLKLMRKGVSGLQNILLLRLCHANGIVPSWNYLYGFPKESASDYADQVALIQAIPHLTPPQSWGRIRLDRFSPYVESPEDFGIANIKPCAAYRYIYRHLSPSDVRDLAYYFVEDVERTPVQLNYIAPVVGALNEWRRRHECAFLLSVQREGVMTIVDTRRRGGEAVVRLSRDSQTVLAACDSIVSFSKICEELAADPKDVRTILQELVQLQFVVNQGNRYLSVAVPLNSRSTADADSLYGELLGELACATADGGQYAPGVRPDAK